MIKAQSSMRILGNSPILWLLTAALTACGTGSTPEGGTGNNKAPEVVVRGPDGKALTATSYVGIGETLSINVADTDGSIKKVTYTIDRGQSTELTPAGTIKLTVPKLAGGQHVITVAATDNAGAVTTVDVPFAVDAASPTVNTLLVNGEVLSSTTGVFVIGDPLVLTASATDTRGDSSGTQGPVTLRLLEGSQVRASTTSGSLSVNLATTASGEARAAGTVAFTLEAVDSVGNGVRRTFSLTFKAGAGDTAPVFNWLAPSTDFVRGGGNVQLRASAVRDGNDLSGTITYTATCGTISGSVWTLGGDCTDGSKQTLTASVSTGGRTYTSTRTVTVDASNPTVQIVSPQQGQTFTQNPITVGVSATDAVSGVERVTVESSTDGTNFVPIGVVASAQGSVTWAPVSGKYTLRAVATDRTGRTSTVSVNNIQVALATNSVITPEVPVLTGNTYGTSPVYVQGLGTVGGAAVSTSGVTSGQLLVDGQASGTSTAAGNGTAVRFNFNFSDLNEGLHDLGIRWMDTAGVVTDSAKISVYVDKTAPVVRWNSPVDGTVTNRALLLNAVATDMASGLRGDVTYSSGGQSISSPWTPSVDGTYVLTASATDRVGNVAVQNAAVTFDSTGPVITATAPTNAQEFTTAPVTIAATATDNLTGVAQMEAVITAPGEAPVTLGIQNGSTYSTLYTPVKSGAYTVVFTALDRAGNSAGKITRNFVYNVTTPPTEKAPSPTLRVVGSGPFTGNMSVDVSANLDSTSTIDRVILQVSDTNGVTDNTTYVSPQARASFSVDTTRFANGTLTLQAIAYTKSGLRGTSSSVTEVQVVNVSNPLLTVTVPADGATVTTPTVPVRLTVTKQGNTAYTFDPSGLQLALYDYRGQQLELRTTTTSTPIVCVSSVDLATYTCDTTFDMAGLPADTYTIRASAPVKVGGVAQTLKTESRFTSNTASINPPAAIIRFPTAINVDGIRNTAVVNSDSGFFATVSDNTSVQYVEARIVGPYAAGNIEADGTKQCQSSGQVVGSPIDVLLLNVPGSSLNPYQEQDVFVANLDVDGSTYVPDSATGQRYDLRVTVADGEGNRNIQCVPIRVQRGARQTYSTSISTTPGTPDTSSGNPTYTSGTWTINGINNTSRLLAVSSANGARSTSFVASAQGSYSVSQTFAAPGAYELKWLIQDLTTGVVTTVNGGVINVARNP